MAGLGQTVLPLVSSRACWSGCCCEMVRLTQLFVLHTLLLRAPSRASRVSGSFPKSARSACSLPSSACALRALRVLPHALAGLTAVARWSGSVTSLCLHLPPDWLSINGLLDSALCLCCKAGQRRTAQCLPLSPFICWTCWLTRFNWAFSRKAPCRKLRFTRSG